MNETSCFALRTENLLNPFFCYKIHEQPSLMSNQTLKTPSTYRESISASKLIQSASTRKKFSRNVSTINQNIFRTLISRRKIIWESILKPNAKRGLIWYRSWNSWDLLVSPSFLPHSAGISDRGRKFHEVIRLHAIALRLPNDDATDKKSHSFMAVRRLISILIRFAFL